MFMRTYGAQCCLGDYLQICFYFYNIVRKKALQFVKTSKEEEFLNVVNFLKSFISK